MSTLTDQTNIERNSRTGTSGDRVLQEAVTRALFLVACDSWLEIATVYSICRKKDGHGRECETRPHWLTSSLLNTTTQLPTLLGVQLRKKQIDRSWLSHICAPRRLPPVLSGLTRIVTPRPRNTAQLASAPGDARATINLHAHSRNTNGEHTSRMRREC